MSSPNNQPLSLVQAERFRRAADLLRSGRHAEALILAERLVAAAPRAADAWQLLAMSSAEGGLFEQASAAFERTAALVPGNAVISNNYAVFLARYGKHLRGQGRPDRAEPILRKAVALMPENAPAWVDLGVVLRASGRFDEAMEALRKAQDLMRSQGVSQPELEDAINGVLADAGRSADAVAGARRLIASHPAYPPAYETMTHLLWEHGADLSPEEDPLDGFRAAARAQPDNQPLQVALVRTLLAAKHAEEALARIEVLRQRSPDSALLDWFAGDALDALHQSESAARLYEAVARSELGRLPQFLNAHTRHAFRTRRFDLALRCAEQAVRSDPRNQEGWANLGTAWRLLGDSREYWLCDYERLVGYVEVTPPPEFEGLPEFLQALAHTLDAMHSARRQPIHQSVRGGTQTTGQLFGRNTAVIRSMEASLRRAAEHWVATLPRDETHPFLSLKRSAVRFVGSWSVRLKASGRHTNHIHPMGWASSAFYVRVPAGSLASRDNDAGGSLQFGQPLDDLGLGLSPRRILQPRPGYLALFPSFFWHGTVPFEAPDSRLAVAFDMQPTV